MLRHFNCASVDSRKEAAETASAAVAPTTVKNDAPAAAAGTSTAEVAPATTGQGVKASTSFVTASAPCDLVTLPPMTSISITCRLFGSSNGKLLSHFEDDLELYPPPEPSGSSSVSSVVRDPITFHIPVEPRIRELPPPPPASLSVLESSPRPPVELPAAYSAAMRRRQQQQQHQNNSYFDSCRRHRCSAAPATAVLSRASPLSAASDAVSTPRLSEADATTTDTGASCCSRNFYGSIRALRLEQQLLLPAKTGAIGR